MSHRFLAMALLVVAACADDGRGRGTGTNPQLDFSQGPGFDGGASENCSDAAKLVYLVDENNDFLSFDPGTLTFTKIGTLDCPTADFTATPFSMGVDRTPTAWVLYNDGELFKVSTTDASCQPTSFHASSSLGNFGMGFASNSAGSSDETLYIAGGPVGASAASSSSTFATLGFPNLAISTKGTVTGWPELTGTGDGALWGFFPSDIDIPRVAQLDKGSGADGTVFHLPSLSGTPKAWAFAQWGGSYWVFLKKDFDSSTTVYKVDGQSGMLTTAKSNTGRTIVGAGVSTCAPTMIL